jgi:hypothetical protein
MMMKMSPRLTVKIQIAHQDEAAVSHRQVADRYVGLILGRSLVAGRGLVARAGRRFGVIYCRRHAFLRYAEN